MNARQIAAAAYRRAAAPFGRRALQRMVANGLPRPLERPLRFLFDGEVSPRTHALMLEIERVRDDIASHTGPYVMPKTSTADGSKPWSWLARNVSVQQRWGLFLHLCAEAVEASSILELGSCVGISGAYLASTPAQPRLTTIEASPELAAVARTTISRFSANAEVLQGMFDERLPEAVARPVDLAYIDGHHDGAATIRYVSTIAPSLRPGALVVLDDIRLYAEMMAAWTTLRSASNVAAAVDVGRFGLLLWGSGNGQLYDLSRYTGAWPRARRSRIARPDSP